MASYNRKYYTKVLGASAFLVIGVFFCFQASLLFGFNIHTLACNAGVKVQQVTSIDNDAFVQGVTWSPDGKKLAISIAYGSQVKVWTKDGVLLNTLHLSVMFVGNSIAFVDNGRYLVTSPARGKDGDVVPALTIWDVSSGEIFKELAGPAPGADARYNRATKFAVSPDGVFIAMTTSSIPERSVSIYRTDDWTLQATIPLQGDLIDSLAFLNSTKLLLGTVGGLIVSVDLNHISEQPTTLIQVYPKGMAIGVNALAVSANGEFIASGGGIAMEAIRKNPDAAPVKIWETSNMKLVAAYNGAFWPVRGLSWGSHGREIAAAGGDRNVHSANVATGKQETLCFSDELSGIQYSPDQSMLAITHGRSVSIFK